MSQEDHSSQRTITSHGGRYSKGKKRKKVKGADEYAAENPENFVSRTVLWKGEQVQVLVCRICSVSVGARSDRIKEHLNSKRHARLLMARLFDAQRAGEDFNQNELIEPPIINISTTFENILGAKSRKTKEEEMSQEVAPPPTMIQGYTVRSTPSPSRVQKEISDFFSRPISTLSDGRTGNNGLLERDNSSVSSDRVVGSPSTTDGTIRRRRFSTPARLSASSSSSQSLLEKETPSLLIKWSNFDSNLISMFSKYRDQNLFVDATLMSCEGKAFRCHQLVLAASSEYFEEVFKSEGANSRPVIVFNELRSCEVEALVRFMYNGEVIVEQEKVQSLLDAAKKLKVKGLYSPSSETAMPSDDKERKNSLNEEIRKTTATASNSTSCSQDSGLGIMEEDDNEPNCDSRRYR